MLVQRRATPSSMSLVPIYTPGWRETMWGKVSCLRTQHDGRDWASKQRPSDLKSNALTATPPRPHLRCKRDLVKTDSWLAHTLFFAFTKRAEHDCGLTLKPVKNVEYHCAREGNMYNREVRQRRHIIAQKRTTFIRCILGSLPFFVISLDIHNLIGKHFIFCADRKTGKTYQN